MSTVEERKRVLAAKIANLLLDDMGDTGILVRRLTPRPARSSRGRSRPTKASAEVARYILSRRGHAPAPKIVREVLSRFELSIHPNLVYKVWKEGVR